ncbi:MAG: hemolysin family protein [Oscillospiraceae bacterium]
MDDGSRSTANQQTNNNEHKAARVLLAPLIALNRGLSALLKKALGANYADVTEDQVRDLVDALASDDDEDGIEENSAQMINNIFEFDNLTAADVMTHRTSIVGVDINTITLDDLIYLALDMGFSRIPVYEDSVDKIIGIVIVKDLLCLVGKPDLTDFNISEFLRDVSFIPEACPCSDVFKTLTELKSGMAVVVDEYGGTAGIVTLEDIIEEVMGNIQDEYDDEKNDITRIDDNTYDVSGEADPETVFELFGIELPEDHEYETIAGFVTDKLGYIPEGGELVPPAVEYEGVRLVVLQVEDRTIEKIRVSRTVTEEQQEK